MRTFLSFLPAVACLAMMLFMCGPMMLKMMRNRSSGEADERSPDVEMAELRDEIGTLKAKLALQEQAESERQL